MTGRTGLRTRPVNQFVLMGTGTEPRPTDPRGFFNRLNLAVGWIYNPPLLCGSNQEMAD